MEINFANEREKLKINAEKAKREIEKEAHKEAQKNIIRETTHTQKQTLNWCFICRCIGNWSTICICHRW